MTIDSPQPRYYTESAVPIELTSESAELITWNIYTGTHLLYTSPKTYTSSTRVSLGNGEYELQVWVGGQLIKKVVFGVNLRNSGAVYASGGSNAEIQTAINSATEGYAVYLPAGMFAFDSSAPWTQVNVPAGISIYGAPALRDADGQVVDSTWATVLTMPYDAADYSRFFEYTGSSSIVTRITGLKLVGYREIDPANIKSTYEALHISGGAEYRIDHCYFRNVPGSGTINIFGAKGVLDHCILIVDPYTIIGMDWEDDTSHYGIVFCGITSWLPLSDVVGKYNNRDWYVEDNYFSGYSVVCQTNNAGHYVFRYNTVLNGLKDVSLHSNVATGYGGRCQEVYGNTFTNKPLGTKQQVAVGANCGTMICTGNTFNGYGYPPGDDWEQAVQLRQANLDIHAWSQIQDCYIWGNTALPSGADMIEIKYGIVGANNPIVLNVDYFLRAPTVALDGWTYVPYTYPHPLVD